jgi:hypothetical protein
MMVQHGDGDVTAMETTMPIRGAGEIMADIDEKLATNPYVMIDVAAIFPKMAIDEDTEEGQWFTQSIFWAANVAQHEGDEAFESITREAHYEPRNLLGMMMKMMMPEHNTVKEAAMEYRRLVALVNTLSRSSVDGGEGDESADE